jgi:hypothetical protein
MFDAIGQRVFYRFALFSYFWRFDQYSGNGFPYYGTRFIISIANYVR